MQSIRLDTQIPANISSDNSYIGLHRWTTSQWPGVDYLVQTTVPFKNGGIVRMAAWDGAGGGYSLFIDGRGPCAGWYVYIGHLSYDPKLRYFKDEYIGPDEIIGEPGCSGFENNCNDQGSKIPPHNHYSLGYSQNNFNFNDGTIPSFVDGYYWIHPARVENISISSTVQTTNSGSPAVDTSSGFVDFEDNFFESTKGKNITDPNIFVAKRNFRIPVWIYLVIVLSFIILLSRNLRPIGVAGIVGVVILLPALYFTTPLPEPPGQLIYVEEDALTLGLITAQAPTQLVVQPSTQNPPATFTPAITTEDGKPSKNPADYPLNNTPCEVNASYGSTVLQWCGLITYYAKARGLDPNFIAAVITQESGGNPEACDPNGHMVVNGIAICGSSSGAIGLMQVMPSDGLSGSKYSVFKNRPTSLQLLNPELNIAYGTKMLSSGGAATNPREALFHYGPANVGYYYADIVMSIYNSHK